MKFIKALCLLLALAAGACAAPPAPSGLANTLLTQGGTATFTWVPATGGLYSTVLAMNGVTKTTVSSPGKTSSVTGLAPGAPSSFTAWTVDSTGAVSAAIGPVVVTIPGPTAAQSTVYALMAAVSPSGASTLLKTDGTGALVVSSSSGGSTTVTGNVIVTSSVLPTGAATSANQATSQGSLSTLVTAFTSGPTNPTGSAAVAIWSIPALDVGTQTMRNVLHDANGNTYTAAYPLPVSIGGATPGVSVTASLPFGTNYTGAMNISNTAANPVVVGTHGVTQAGPFTVSGSASVTNFPSTYPVTQAGPFTVSGSASVTNFPSTYPVTQAGPFTVSGSASVTQAGPFNVSGSVQLQTGTNYVGAFNISNTATSPVYVSFSGAVGVNILNQSFSYGFGAVDATTQRVTMATNGQTTAVSVTAALPAGTNNIGHVTQDGFNGTSITSVSTNALGVNISKSLPVAFGQTSVTASVNATGQYTLLNNLNGVQDIWFSLTGTAWNDGGGSAVIPLVSGDGVNWAIPKIFDQSLQQQTGGINHANSGGQTGVVWHVQPSGNYFSLSFTSLTGGQVSITAGTSYSAPRVLGATILSTNGQVISNGQLAGVSMGIGYNWNHALTNSYPVRTSLNHTTFTAVVGGQQGLVALTPTSGSTYQLLSLVIGSDTTGKGVIYDSAGATMTSFQMLSNTTMVLGKEVWGDWAKGSGNNATVNITFVPNTATLTGSSQWDTP